MMPRSTVFVNPGSYIATTFEGYRQDFKVYAARLVAQPGAVDVEVWQE